MSAEFPRLRAPEGAKPKPGIVHLGLGAFFRAHGAIYIADAMAKSGGDWGIIGVSLMRPDQRDRLKPQGFAYTAMEMGPAAAAPRILNILSDVLVAREDPGRVLAAMADPAIRIVTLTVTEKGYCHEPSTGALNRAHPDIVHDLGSEAPRSAVGFLVRALQMRRDAGAAPFTVLCCDNLPENGRLVRRVVLDLAGLIDPGLASWIAREGAFPSTMVDRIVPAVRPEDIAALAEKTGSLDLSPVMHEPFNQWVIEDKFVNAARPDFAAAGAQMVDDVSAFEHMKLRCLNGTHSALAYLGYLAGFKTIYETVSNPGFADFCNNLWKMDILPGLVAPEGTDLQAYTRALFDRYSNPAIRHLTWQIAMDGSQKLPQRILGTIADNIAAGRDSAGLILAVAAWMRYVGAVDETGLPIEVKDPMAARLKALSDAAPDTAGKARALLGVREVFPESLATNPAFRNDVVAIFVKLTERGAKACVEECYKD